jgi:3-phenylpropionate/cinnamic acid dioxygenase small subunit
MDRAADHIAIRELTARYNRAVDDCRYDEWADCFTEDGIFEVVGVDIFAVHEEIK